MKQELARGSLDSAADARRAARTRRARFKTLQSRVGCPARRNTASSPAAPPHDGFRTMISSRRSQQQQQLLSTRVDQQYQTKVESGSKYRVRLSGLVLFNASSTRGAVDEQDVPMLAEPHTAGTSGGNISATMRQTLLNVDVFGPEFAGAQDLSLDAVRLLRRISEHPGWRDHGHRPHAGGACAIRLGQMVAEFRSGQAFHLAELSNFPGYHRHIPALATPAICGLGHRRSWPRTHVGSATENLGRKAAIWLARSLQRARCRRTPSPVILSPGTVADSRFRRASKRAFGTGIEKSSIGVGGYFARHDYQLRTNRRCWAGTLDWNVLLDRHFEAVGMSLYRGQALGGFWGGIGASAVFDGDPNLRLPHNVFPVNTIGRLVAAEIQAGLQVGDQQRVSAKTIRSPPICATYNVSQHTRPYLRNWTTMFNVIERPRSNLMFSLEYRHLNTVEFSGKRDTAEHVNLGVGVSF